MADVKGGSWKATNDKNGVGTLSYTIGSQTVAKIAGLATLAQDGGSIFKVDSTTGEKTLLIEGTDYGINIEATSTETKTVNEEEFEVAKGYKGTIDLSKKILGTTKLTRRKAL